MIHTLFTIWCTVAPIAQSTPAERLQNALSDLSPYVEVAIQESDAQKANQPPKRNVWGAAAKRMAHPAWYPYWTGVVYDLYTTDSVLSYCAQAPGWSCREGNPLAGGNTNAGRIATTVGISYGIALLFTWVEEFETAKSGKVQRVPWWAEMISMSAAGTVRGLVGRHNAHLEERIRESIR